MRFDPNNGNKPTQSTVKTGTLVIPPKHNPVREGFQFEGWTLDDQPYDFQTPILQDLTLTAKWAKTTDWTLSPDHGPATGAQLTISPPDKQEPYYTSIHTAGDRSVGLTGDGRIYTWAQDSTPKQVPFPTQAADGFHYLQVATSSQSQVALGSDQHIYTWTNQQATPTILDTGRNTQFTSISMNDDRLLAVDQQGRIHTLQAGQTDGNDSDPKPVGQATTSLPSQTQAVLAVTSSGRILAQDTDGYVWTWKAINNSSIKPEGIKQDPSMRITLATALSSGFLLLDADGQVQYLADSATSTTAISLPDSQKAGRITTNKNQVMITSRDGHVWAWQPGKAPVRADNGNHYYTQAISIGSKIAAIDGQGGLYWWSLDKQGQPGQPDRLDTTTDPALDSASMDGQAMTLRRKDGSWQADIPAHKPGQAAILIAGRQDGQSFTRSLKYTVDQTLTREAEPGSTHTVTFDTAGGSQAPESQQVSYPYGRVQRPLEDPVRKGYQFDGWFIGEAAYDFSKPVSTSLTLIAKWTPEIPDNTWKISPDKGSQLGGQQTTITPPNSISNVKFNQISSSSIGSFSLAVGSDGNAYAWGDNTYGQLGDGTTNTRTTPVPVLKPAGAPIDFTYVQVSAGWRHSMAVGSDGYAYAWGFNPYGQLGNNTTSDSDVANHVPTRVRDPDSPTNKSKGLKAIQVSAGIAHSLAMSSDGYVYAWGYNLYGRLGNNTDNYEANLVPTRVRDPDSPTNKRKGLKAIQISVGGWHSLAVGSDGYAYAWGYNRDGQLGNNTTTNSAIPVHVYDPDSPANKSKGLKAVQVSAGWHHSMAIDDEGNTRVWGDNQYGQLGNNTTTNSAIPVHVRNPDSPTDTSKELNAIQISAGGWHSLAVGSDGYAYAWGNNQYGELGNNTTNRSNVNPVPIPVGEPGSPTDKSRGLKATQVSAGCYHALAVDTEGIARAWGDNRYGQLGNDGIPTGENNSKAQSPAPVPVVFNLQPVITGVTFDLTAAKELTRGDGNSAIAITPPHLPGTVTVNVSYTLGGAGKNYNTLQYTYLPAGVLPNAGGEGILLALAAGTVCMGGVLASRRHRREQHRLSHASHE